MEYGKVVISDQGAKYQKEGQSWVYANNVISCDETAVNGDAVQVVGEDGEFYGIGLVSLSSHIAVRILSRSRTAVIGRSFFEQRIRDAWELRKYAEPENLTNCRIIYGEADLLPGLTVDRFNDVLVVQISAFGMELRKEMLYEILLQVLREDGQQINCIYEKNDIAVREKEGLERSCGFWKDAEHSGRTVIEENGLKLEVDFVGGQKTGYFLDQKSNRVLLRKIAKGRRVLDCFSHTGGFALNAAYGGASGVTAVDVSGTALAQGKINAELNGLEERMRFVQADVFEYLDECTPGQYDIIVLDPPAFTKSRKTVNRAYYGYKRINCSAMKLLRDNKGILLTCSCSRYMENELFEKMLKEAAQEAGVLLQQLSITQQNMDHPSLRVMDETSYLKFYMFRILPNE